MNELHYITLLSAELRNFRRRGRTFNFSCPICGDSRTDRLKARGYLYEDRRSRDWWFYCHNQCGGMSFDKFLRTVNPTLHREWIADKFKNDAIGNASFDQRRTVVSLKKRAGLESIMTPLDILPSDSVAVCYAVGRSLPRERWGEIFFTTDLNTIKGIFPKYADRSFEAEPRLVFAIKDRRGDLVGVVARAIDPKSKLRYVTLTATDDVELIFGIDGIDISKRIIVVEGPIDSLFVDNSVAACGGDFTHVYGHLIKGRDILVFDNTPRNTGVVRQMRRAGHDGWNVVVWPKDLPHKDINDMVRAGMTRDEIRGLIEANAFSGMELEMKIANWDKTNDN